MQVNSILNNFKSSLVFGCGISKRDCTDVINGEFQNKRPDYKKDEFKYPKYNINPDFVLLKDKSKYGASDIAGQIHREKIADNEVLYVVSNPKDNKSLGYAILSFGDTNIMAGPVPKHLKDYFADAPYLKKIISYKFDDDGEELNLAGVGTNLVKCALKESIKTGHQGKLAVLACDTQNPFNAPTIFYHKLGFKFINDAKEEKINELEAEGNLTTEAALDKSINIGVMYLPKENIPRLLNA